MRLSGLGLAWLALGSGCDGKGDSPPPADSPVEDSPAHSDDSPGADDSPADSPHSGDPDSPDDSGAPAPAALRVLSAELEFPSGETGMRLRAYYSVEDAAGAPLPCASGAPEASFSVCPDATCAESWPAARATDDAICGDPATLAFVVAPTDAEGLDALRAALAEADALLSAGGDTGLLVLSSDPPRVLPLSDAANADFSSNADPAGALDAAREALRGVENRGMVLLLHDAPSADLYAAALADLNLGGAALRVIGPQAALDRLPGLDATLRAAEDPAAELRNAAAAHAEAARVLVRNTERVMSCGTLGLQVGLTLDALGAARAWSQRRGCPATMDSAMEGQFFIDPLGLGLHQSVWRYGFGPRRFNDGDYSFHPGIDMEAAEGDPIYAVAPGTVVQAGPRESYEDSGIFVVLDHGGGVRSWYLHMQDVSVSVGQAVARGEVVGRVGSTGASWAHLHFSLSLCPECDIDSLGHYSTQSINPAWLLPRPEGGGHTVTVQSIDAQDPANATVTLEVSAPGAEMDFNALDLALGGVFSGTLDFDAREGCSNRNDPTDGVWTVDPSPGPWTTGASWIITLYPVDLEGGDGSVRAEAIDLWGNGVAAP